MTVDVAAWRKQRGHGDPVEECWLLGGSSVPRERSPALPTCPARLLAAPALAQGPNIPERWKELGDTARHGQSESRAWPSGKTKPCGFPCL